MLHMIRSVEAGVKPSGPAQPLEQCGLSARCMLSSLNSSN